MARAVSLQQTEARQRVFRINPLLENSDMADRSRQMSGFLPLTLRGGIILCTIAFLGMNGGCGPASAQANAPCMKIRAACTEAGFKPGFAKEGFGLEIDCVGPVMQAVPQRAKATKPLPRIEADLIAACKAKNPNFGQRKRAPSQSAGGEETK
jgi:hypothetical protein